MVNSLLVKSYATNVYLTGRNSLESIEVQRPEYVDPVMQYAAGNYYVDDIERAAVNGWVTPQRAADTIALKGPEDPQYRVAPTTTSTAE